MSASALPRPKGDAEPVSGAPWMREQASFWATAGLVLGFLLTGVVAAFFLLVLLSSPPAPPPPVPLDRVAAQRALFTALEGPSEGRYTRVAQAARRLKRDPRCKDGGLQSELEEVARLAELLAAPTEYLLTPVWVEIPPEGDLPESGGLPLLRLETAGDISWSGTKGVLVSERERRLEISSEREIPFYWQAGDPLRLRFSLQPGFFDAASPLGGDDLERAQDAPIPDASILLLGEPRALTRGGGRYLVRVRLAKEGPPLVVPPLLAEAAAHVGKESGR